MSSRPDYALNRTRRDIPSTWRTAVAARRLTWSRYARNLDLTRLPISNVNGNNHVQIMWPNVIQQMQLSAIVAGVARPLASRSLTNFAFCGVLLCLSISACKPRSTISRTPAPLSAQRADVTPLVPAELSYAKEFVQFLNDSGWSIQTVQPSKFNGFFRETKKAAYIETDKGVLEVVFFDTNAAVEHIQITEAARGAPNNHVYVIKYADTTQRTEGAGATYFTKYRNMFIITIDRDLNDRLHLLLK